MIYENEASSERDNLWVGQASDGYKKIFLYGIKTRADARFCPGVLKYIRRDAYDIVVVGGYATPTAMLAITVLRAKGIPFLLNADGGFISEHESRLNGVIKRHFISCASGWLSTGALTSKYLKYYGAAHEKIYEYPFSSVKQADILNESIPEEQKSILRKELGIGCNTLFIAVGQFIPRKGLLNFLKEWVSEQRQGIGILLIGGGPEENEYRQIAGSCPGIWVRSFMEKKELADYYKAADALVLPTNEDIWGLVVNEAMSYGLPVFSTSRCIAAMTLEGAGVSVFPVGDNIAMADAMVAYATSENKAIFAANSISKSREYTIEKMAQRHIKAFEDVLKGRSK